MDKITSLRAQKRCPSYMRDEHKNSIVHLPLSDGTTAIVDACSYHKLTKVGVTNNWTVNSDGDGRAYIRCRYKGNMTTVARLISSAVPNTIVRHRNGDTRDLRIENLKITRCQRKHNVT